MCGETGATTSPILLPAFSDEPLNAQQIRFELRIPVFFGPDVEGQGRNLVDNRNSVSVLSQVNRFDVRPACVAGVHTCGRKIIGGIDREPVLVLLTAVRAENAAIRPLGRAQRTGEPAFAALALTAQNTRYG